MALDLSFEYISKINEEEDCNYLGAGWLKAILAVFFVTDARSVVECYGTIDKRTVERGVPFFYGQDHLPLKMVY